MRSRIQNNHESARTPGAPLTAAWICVLSAMRKFSRLKWRYVVALGVSLAAICLASVYWQATRALRQAAEIVRTSGEFHFITRPVAPPSVGFEWINTPPAFSGGAVFNGKLFLAGSIGLFEYDKQGSLIKHYRPGQELPASPLVRVTTGV